MPDRKIAQVVERTIDLAVGDNVVEDIVGQPIVPWLAGSHSVTPPWWSFARDTYLRDFWKQSSSLALMMYTAQTLLANTPMRVEPKNPAIASHVEQAEMYHDLLWKASEFGETLFAAKARFAEDYLAQDNGGFVEVIGDGSPDGPIVGPPLAVRHLDAQYCYRTRNSIYPVVYHNPIDGKAYKIHYTRVIAMSQMSSTELLMNGVGFSAVSRSLQFGQHLYDIYVYKQEKLGSRPISKLIVGSGFRGSHIMQAVKSANEVMSNQNLSRYSKIIGIGSDDVAASLNTLDLNDFDPFDEEISVIYAMYGLAASFGIPIQEVWPTSGGKSGGKSGDQQESRQRGKLPAEFNAQLSLQLSTKYLPPYLRVVADWRDDYQDERKAINQDIRARNRERDLGNEAITIRTSREQMVHDGDITRQQFNRMELEGGRLESSLPIAMLFYSSEEPYKELLKVPGVKNPTAVMANEKEDMLEAIDEQAAKVHAVMAETTSPREGDKLNRCIFALDWLRAEYELRGVNALPMELAIAAGVPERGDPNLKPLNAGNPLGLGATGKPASGPAGQQASKPEDDKKPTRDPDQVRTGSLVSQPKKQVNDSNFLEFLITMEGDLLEEFARDNPSKDKIKEIVIGWLLFAYLEGIGKSEDDLTSVERSEIKEQRDAFLDQLDTIMERKANGNDMEATVLRLTNQVAGLFWLGFVKAENQDDKFVWILGSTKEHCSDCLGSEGKSRTKKEWAKAGKLPQSGLLECTGRNCLCYLQPADD